MIHVKIPGKDTMNLEIQRQRSLPLSGAGVAYQDSGV
jgi:hypothetical protein